MGSMSISNESLPLDLSSPGIKIKAIMIAAIIPIAIFVVVLSFFKIDSSASKIAIELVAPSSIYSRKT